MSPRQMRRKPREPCPTPTRTHVLYGVEVGKAVGLGSIGSCLTLFLLHEEILYTHKGIAVTQRPEHVRGKVKSET